VSNPVLTARDIEVAYSAGATSVRALKGVSTSIEAGLVTLIQGPSGSGKTTLLSVLGCLRQPDSGSLSAFGRDVGSLSAKGLARLRRERIGFVFQSFRLFSRLNARQNVELPLALLGRDPGERRRIAAGLLAAFGLSAVAEQSPSRLSGGEQQRIAVARAVAADPEVVLADEPTAALDRECGRQVGRALRRSAMDHGRAVVVVSHDPRLEEFADRVLAMEDGQLKGGGAQP
jgi:putative ABC transport system ATP-binding protein